MHAVARSSLFVVALLVAEGCAAPQASLQIQALSAGTAVATRLPLHGVLRSGDQFFLQLEVPRPAFVYAFQGSDAWAKQLFPASGHTLVPAQTPYYMPAPGEYFPLGDAVGSEKIVVVASVQQLGDDELRRFLQLDDGVHSRDATAPATPTGPTSPPPPPVIGPKDKPGYTYAIKAPLGLKRPAVLRFVFAHVATGSIP